MNIQEMHVMFRQFAQQMGLQNIRTILPEQIDLVLNTSIIDITNQLIRSTVGVSNDRIITENSKISQINAFRKLYKVSEINILPSQTYKSTTVELDWTNFGDKFCLKLGSKYIFITVPTITDDRGFRLLISTIQSLISRAGYANQVTITGDYENTDADQQVELTFTTKDNGDIANICVCPYQSTDDATKEYADKHQTICESYTNVALSFAKKDAYSGKLTGTDYWGVDYMYLVDFSIKYKVVTKGFSDTGTGYEFEADSFESNYFPVRLIDDAYLADTINDFQLAPKLRSPIIVNHDDKFDLYFPSFVLQSDGSWMFKNNLLPYTLRFSYIAKPVEVKYDEDLLGNDVNCDLPDYLHVDIVKHAVELYMQAIGKGVSSQDQQSNQVNNGESTTPQQRQ